MLQVCVERLRELWPRALLQVLTGAPDRLTRLCPQVRPLPSEGRIRWFSEPPDGHGRRSGARRHAAAAARALRGPAPRLALAIERRVRGLHAPEVGEFLSAVRRADLVLIGGRGGTTDAFLDDSCAILGLLELAADAGIPTAMVGQGMGPAADDELLRRARRVLPSAALIALREGVFGPELLAGLGLSRDRLLVTGDDSVEHAFKSRSPRGPEPQIGVSLRFAPYYETSASDAEALRSPLRELRRSLGAELVALPISLLPEEADADAIQAVTGERMEVELPGDVIRQAGRCRVVIAASYHAAVFALSQGVPVVGLARSDYQRQKLVGLADQFGAGCAVLALDDPDLSARLRAEAEAAWRAAPELRDQLLEAARRQVQAGRAAYERLSSLVPT